MAVWNFSENSSVLVGTSFPKYSDITNSTIVNTKIAFSDIKHSSIKDYKEKILCFEIEYCSNRENITEGKVHHFLFFYFLQTHKKSKKIKVCRWTRKRTWTGSACNHSNPKLSSFPLWCLLPLLCAWLVQISVSN